MDFLQGAMRSRQMRSRGLLDRLNGAAPLGERQAALNDAMAQFEHAAKVGDDVARDLADARIERLLAEARAERSEPQEPRLSFDGGVRGITRPIAPPAGGMRVETPAELFARALQASHARRNT